MRAHRARAAKLLSVGETLTPWGESISEERWDGSPVSLSASRRAGKAELQLPLPDRGSNTLARDAVHWFLYSTLRTPPRVN